MNQKLDKKLKDAAQKALDAIDSKLELTASTNGRNHTHHVFNNNLLKFHTTVLEDLLKDLGHYDEEMNNLKQYLVIPLTENDENYIEKMVTSFSPEDEYVDYNADVYGEYTRELRQALVAYLKAYTSVNEAEREGIHEFRRKVRKISSEMANHEVYVDPMALKSWLQENQKQDQVYKQVKDKLKDMFQNILDNFENVSEWIRGLCARNWKR